MNKELRIVTTDTLQDICSAPSRLNDLGAGAVAVREKLSKKAFLLSECQLLTLLDTGISLERAVLYDGILPYEYLESVGIPLDDCMGLTKRMINLRFPASSNEKSHKGLGHLDLGFAESKPVYSEAFVSAYGLEYEFSDDFYWEISKPLLSAIESVCYPIRNNSIKETVLGLRREARVYAAGLDKVNVLISIASKASNI